MSRLPNICRIQGRRHLWASKAINSFFKELESVEEERAVITGVGRVGDVVVEEMMFAKMWRQTVYQLSQG